MSFFDVDDVAEQGALSAGKKRFRQTEDDEGEQDLAALIPSSTLGMGHDGSSVAFVEPVQKQPVQKQLGPKGMRLEAAAGPKQQQQQQSILMRPVLLPPPPPLISSSSSSMTKNATPQPKQTLSLPRPLLVPAVSTVTPLLPRPELSQRPLLGPSKSPSPFLSRHESSFSSAHISALGRDLRECAKEPEAFTSVMTKQLTESKLNGAAVGAALLIEDEKAQVGQARLFCADAICSAASLLLDLQRRIANLDRPLQLKQRL